MSAKSHVPVNSVLHLQLVYTCTPSPHLQSRPAEEMSSLFTSSAGLEKCRSKEKHREVLQRQFPPANPDWVKADLRTRRIAEISVVIECDPTHERRLNRPPPLQ
jgi:hypothetical protein